VIPLGIEVPNKEELSKKYKTRMLVYEKILSDLALMLEKDLYRNSIKASVKHRVKSFDSYFKKLLVRLRERQRTGKDEPITDLMGIRIVCPFLENIQEVESLVRKEYLVVEVEKKGNGHSVREFGYESTHLLITVPKEIITEETTRDLPEPLPEEELFCEIQIRTILQDAWAEVEHELVYKAEFTPFDKPLKRKLAALNANLTLSDIIFQEIREYQRQLQRELKRRRHTFFSTVSDRTEALLPTLPEGGAEKTSEEDNDSLITGAGNTMDELLLRGLLAHNNGDYSKAIRIYTKLLDLDVMEMKSLVFVHRGMAYFAESNYQEAAMDFSRSIEQDRNNARTYYLRGITNRMMEEYGEALKDFNIAVSIDPFQFDFLYARAQVYFHMGDYPAGLKDCEKALNLNPLSKEAGEFMKVIRKKMRL